LIDMEEREWSMIIEMDVVAGVAGAEADLERS
jgi:hypothetical protein